MIFFLYMPITDICMNLIKHLYESAVHIYLTSEIKKICDFNKIIQKQINLHTLKQKIKNIHKIIKTLKKTQLIHL